jgi:hypothetical protein
MADALTFEYELTDEQIDRVTGATDINRKFLRALPAFLLLIPVPVAVLLGNEWWLDSDVIIRWASLIVLVFFGGLLLLMSALQAFALLMLGLARRRLRSAASTPQDRMIRWEFADDAFRVTCSKSDRTVGWDAVTCVGTGDDFWTLRVKDGPELFLPATFLTREMRMLIRTKTSEAKRIRRPLTTARE